MPIPTTYGTAVVFAALSNGNLVAGYTSGSHFYVLNLAAGASAWSAPLDLTPTWKVSISGPVARAARQGGVLLALTGNSTSYRCPYFFSSADGISFGAGEYMSSTLSDAVMDIDAECLAQPVALLTAGYGAGPRLTRYAAGNWIALDGPPSWPNGGGSATVLSDGRTYWAYTQNNSAVTQFSVTMRGSP